MLKKSLPLILLLLVPFGLKAQKNPQILFDQANKLLNEGKIVQALDRYQQLIDQKKISGALLINTGYAYVQLGKLGKAKYYFLKAKRFDETDQIAIEGLKMVESRLSHHSMVLPPLPWEQALNWLTENMGAVLILAIGLILINLGVFILIISWLQKKGMSFIPKISTAVAAIGILFILLSFFINYRQQRYSKAIVVTSKTTVVKKPSIETASVSKAYEGYRFTVDHKKSKNHGKWVFIQMSNGNRGWIQRKEIMIL